MKKINRKKGFAMAKISVNKETCIGCGACVGTADMAFEMVDGKSAVKAGFDYDSSDDAAKKAVDDAIAGCPVHPRCKNRRCNPPRNQKVARSWRTSFSLCRHAKTWSP